MELNQDFEWVPKPELIESSNLTAFIRKTGEPSLSALEIRAELDPSWLTAQVMEFCNFRFYRPYTQMLDTSNGMEHARWCVDGTAVRLLGSRFSWSGKVKIRFNGAA